MMKKYIAPEMEITSFKAVDILTLSGGTGEVKLATLDATTFDSDDGLQFGAYNG